MSDIHLLSRAKVNLTLEVLGRRRDSYHEIDSIVQVIDIADEMAVSKAPPGVLEVSAEGEGAPSGKSNLVHRACRAFFSATGIQAGARCEITKRIPVAAGLGGGSGNAAAAVAALNLLCQRRLTIDQLSLIVAQVGSDSPLFLHGGTVRMRGRGEKIEPLPDAPELHIVVVKPDVGVSTKWAYAELDKTQRSARGGASDRAQAAIETGDRGALIESLHNDFDQIVSSAHEEICSAKEALVKLGAQRALLAGSGSAVFGVFASADGARAAASRLSSLFSNVFVTRSLPRSESLISGSAHEQD